MKFKKLLTATFIISSFGINTLFAGTPNIKGIYKGTYDFEIKSSHGHKVANSTKTYNWTLDFDNGKITIQDGKITTLISGNIPYKITGIKSLTNNKDGTYSFITEFQANTLIAATPKVLIKSILEITQTSEGLLIKTLDSDKDGILGSVSSAPDLDISLILPKKIELNWFGNAE